MVVAEGVVRALVSPPSGEEASVSISDACRNGIAYLDSHPDDQLESQLDRREKDASSTTRRALFVWHKGNLFKRRILRTSWFKR